MMNALFLESVRALYDLPPLQNAAWVEGGLSHRLARLDAENGSFALKVLSRRAVQSEAGRAQFERAETVALLAFDAGVPTVRARRGPDGNFVQNARDHSVVLYPWRAGEVLPPTAADVAVCAQMGALLGRLHAAQIRFPDQNAPAPEAFALGHFERLAAHGARENAVWEGEVRAYLSQLESINARALKSQLELRESWVTGHLDFDQKNVLWHQAQPTILDWESAKPIHPALEALGAGLSWAGQSAGQTNRQGLRAFFEGYARHNTLERADIARASEGVLGKWLIWLEFNLRRSLEPQLRGSEEERVCHDALFHALRTTLQLADDAAIYRAWLMD